jgi:hypothetical protein
MTRSRPRATSIVNGAGQKPDNNVGERSELCDAPPDHVRASGADFKAVNRSPYRNFGHKVSES